MTPVEQQWIFGIVAGIVIGGFIGYLIREYLLRRDILYQWVRANKYSDTVEMERKLWAEARRRLSEEHGDGK
jgi:hypothetical protein